jgi:hypothetical protein
METDPALANAGDRAPYFKQKFDHLDLDSRARCARVLASFGMDRHHLNEERSLAYHGAVKFATILFLLSSLCGAATKSPKGVTLKAASPKPAPYEDISFVTEGPAHSFSDGDVRGRFERLLVLAPELASDPPTLRVETMTYGDEICCRKVVDAWEIGLGDLFDAGMPVPDPTSARFSFSRWRDARTAEFRYGRLACRVKDIGLPAAKVSCGK